MLNLEPINYHHLFYFWTAAREGGISHASNALDLSPSTVSSQISDLEKSLGTKLFRRSGRNLVLTAEGHIAFRFAEEIFVLGQDLRETIRGRSSRRRLRLAVGVADVVPKLVATKLLDPAMALGVRLVCRQGRPAALLADLALHLLDVVLLDSPVGPQSKVRAFSHVLARSPLNVVGAPELVARYRDGFPDSLDGAPFLLPTYESYLRPILDRWFNDNNLRPVIAGEFDDSALMKAFGERAVGLLVATELAWPQAQHHYDLELLGSLEPAVVSFYAATVEQKVRHPAVVAILGQGEKSAPR